MKSMAKSYKQYIRQSTLGETGPANITKPFLLVQISCPPDAYDVNVEPAKDEVLFYNPPLLTGLFEKLMQSVYGNIDTSEAIKSGGRSAKATATPNSFDLLLARKPNHQDSLPIPATSFSKESSAGDLETSAHARDSSRPSGDSDTGEVTGTPNAAREQESEEDEGIDDANVRNPWSLAKLNVRVPPKQLLPRPHASTHDTNDDQSPAMPFQNPGPPMQRRGPRPPDPDSESVTSSASPDEELSQNGLIDSWVNKLANIRPQGISATDVPLQADQKFVHHASPQRRQSNLPSPRNTSPVRPSAASASHQQRLSLPFKTPFNRASHLPPGTQASLDQTLQTPPPSDFRGELDEILEFERQKKAIAMQRKQLAARARNQQLVLPSPPGQDSGAEYDDFATQSDIRPASSRTNVTDTTDFEGRFGSQNDLSGLSIPQRKEARSNPHLNRFLAATRALDASATDDQSRNLTHAHPSSASTHDLPTRAIEHLKKPRNTSSDGIEDEEIPKIPLSDPRGYLIQHRREQPQGSVEGLTKTGLKMRRTKTTRLPLELVPVDAETHFLAVEVATQSWTSNEHHQDEIVQATRHLKHVDEYIHTGRVEHALSNVDAGDIERWQGIMRGLVRRYYRSASVDTANDVESNAAPVSADEGLEVEIDLRAALGKIGARVPTNVD
jgi:DNA mismatch repair ATPase MutL